MWIAFELKAISAPGLRGTPASNTVPAGGKKKVGFSDVMWLRNCKKINCIFVSGNAWLANWKKAGAAWET